MRDKLMLNGEEIGPMANNLSFYSPDSKGTYFRVIKSKGKLALWEINDPKDVSGETVHLYHGDLVDYVDGEIKIIRNKDNV